MTFVRSRALALPVSVALTGLVLSAGGLLAQGHSDAGEMESARHHLGEDHGGQTFLTVMGERLEYGASDEEDFALWDLQAWYGSDIHRLWVKSEGEYLTDAQEGTDELEELELQALYSRAVSAYFDLQVGVRHDFEPSPSRSFAVLGVQGLAPYWFHVDAALFLSEDGDVSARLEAEYDILITQRLIAQPRVELDLSASDVPELAIDSGLSGYDAGIRVRYEILRELAPYVGVSWTGLGGGTADLAERAGEPTSSTAVVVGLRFWY